MKHGLIVAVATFKTLIDPDSPARVLVVDARAAVDAIDSNGTFVFQRVAILCACRRRRCLREPRRRGAPRKMQDTRANRNGWRRRFTRCRDGQSFAKTLL